MGPILLVFLYLVSRLCVVADEAKPQIWTRADGQTIEATLTRYDANSGTLTLRSKDGRLQLLSVDLLIEEHRSRLPKRALKKVDPPESLPAAPAQKLPLKEAASKKDPAPPVAAETVRKVTRPKGRWDSFTPDGAGGFSVHVYLPGDYVVGEEKNFSLPALFLFSPDGNSRALVDRARLVADELGWVLIGVDAYRNTSSTEERFEERMAHTRAAYKAARARYAFNPNRVVFGGQSGGGWWSFQCAADLIGNAAGILSCGGWMAEMHNKRYSPQMAVAVINGDQDKIALSWVDRDTSVLSSKARATVKTFSFSGGHVLPPPEVLAEAARWVHQQKRF